MDLEGGRDGWSSSSPRMVIPAVLWFRMNGDGILDGLFLILCCSDMLICCGGLVVKFFALLVV